MKRPSLVALAAVLAAGMITGGYYLYRVEQSGAFDNTLQTALQTVQSPHTYEVSVETSTNISGRTIDVLGLYRLDFDAKRFGAYATTTLTIPEEVPSKRTHAFTLLNISIGDDVFVKIDTESPFLSTTIPHSPEWRHFSTDSIPPDFIDIAVVGPVIDNLALLGNEGEYLLLSSEPVSKTYLGADYRVYTFKLSQAASAVTGGTLEPLVSRIGDGDVMLWIDETNSIRLMTFSGENYVSTTTILSVNTPLYIPTPPAAD